MKQVEDPTTVSGTRDRLSVNSSSTLRYELCVSLGHERVRLKIQHHRGGRGIYKICLIPSPTLYLGTYT